MLSKAAAGFLRKHPPFSFLDQPTLMGLVQALTLKLYPAGALILGPGAGESGGLHIIKEGAVRILSVTGAGDEHLIEHRGVGETFGFLAPGSTSPSDVSVQAVGETVCYVADHASIGKLLDKQPFLRDYLIPGYFPRRPDRKSPPPPARRGLGLETERVLFTTPVRDLAGQEVVTTPWVTPIVEAARLMSARHIGALVIVDDGERPVGMVTCSDLRDRVLACCKDLADPVGEIMSTPLITVAGTDFCFEAFLKMMSRGVHHLLVMEAGRLAGMVTSHDFLVLQGTAPLVVIREIEDQATVDGVADAAGKVRGLIAHLHDQGAGASSILRIITSVNDRIERKILAMAEATLGPPPVPFCWLVFGSAGRKEQTFRTDQDNAIVYQDPAGEKEGLAAEEYCRRLAAFVVDAFRCCGFRLCAGDYMATNPQWRQPLAVWKRMFHSWITAPRERAVFHAVNLFDFRALYGEQRLAADLRRHLLATLPGRAVFFKALVDLAAEYRPPLGLFGSLVLEKDGEHAHHLDLKKKCLAPLNSVVRICSLEVPIPETSTLERLAVLKGRHPLVTRLGDDLGHAFEFLALLRIRHQLAQTGQQIEPDNFIDPRSLSSLELGTVKEICRLVAQAIEELGRRHDLGAQL
ncbi:MAG: DUF294 nucleotidyltransferase-like domain-containing protein [Thermodesulfobacteriota bacterium]